MTYFVVDIEADGPVPPIYSMVSFGAVVLDETLRKTFYGRVRPISRNWLPTALRVAGHTREETLAFPAPRGEMGRFVAWVRAHTRAGTTPQFVSDNNGFDFAFMSYYLWRFTESNLFGHSSRNINDLWHGMQKDMRSSFDSLRRTVHDHHPVNDARGNAEALLKMREKGLRLEL